MSSGNKSMVINTQERAISPDINRLQKFLQKDYAELFRYAMDVTGNDDLDAGSVIAEPNTSENPLRAEIVNGLLVRPQAATLNLLVDPGVGYFMSPDAASDDSNYKYIADAGVPGAGTLIMTANGGGSPRIDVIECRLNPVESIVTDNRDIFNPTTGLFTATSVTKERKGRLEYRIRLGSVGGGFAGVGTASGWLPLCVASVPAGAATVDAITFWDVRPLISDRQFGLSALKTDKPLFRRGQINASSPALTGGWFDTSLNGRKLGGRLRSGSVVADAEVIDLTAAANQATGLVLVANTPYYIYLCTPFGLPRWARYNASGTRVPRSPRGIPVLHNASCDNEGRAFFAIPMPVLTGLGGSTLDAVAVAAGYTTSAAVLGGFYMYDGRTQLCADSIGVADPMPLAPTAITVAAGNVTVRYDSIAGINYPANARELLMEFRAEIEFTNAVAALNVTAVKQWLQLFQPSLATRIVRMGMAGVPITTDGGGAKSVQHIIALCWVPVPNIYPVATGPTNRFEVFYEHGGIANALGGGTTTLLRIWGWKL